MKPFPAARARKCPAGHAGRSWHLAGYLSVKGVRDIASGLVVFILLAAGKPGLLGGFLLAASIIPVGDAIIVLRGNGPKATVYGVHAATAAVMLAAATFLFV